MPWPVLTPPLQWPAWWKQRPAPPAGPGEAVDEATGLAGVGMAREAGPAAAGKRAPVPPEPGPELPGAGRPPRRFHIVGIGGAGMNAIATVLRGHGPRGLGQRPAAPRRCWNAWSASGVRTFVGHDAAHVGDADIVAFSTAVKPDNVELVEARRRGVACISRAAILGAICRTRRTLAVSGTHGKTTTTAMLAQILVRGGPRPGLHGGGRGAGEPRAAPPGARGHGWWSRRTSPTAPFCAWGRRAPWSPTWRPTTSTTTGPKRPWPAPSGPSWSRRRAPGSSAWTTPGRQLWRAAVPGVTTYGTSAGAAYRIDAGRTVARATARFDVSARGRPLGTFELPVPGLHNVRNAVGRSGHRV